MTSIDNKFTLKLEEGRIAATLSNDPDQLSPWLDERLTYIHASGVKDSKKAHLASMQEGRLAYRDIRCEYDDTISLGPEAFMLTGRFDADIKLNGAQVKLNNLFIAVWICRADRRWRLLSWQSTRTAAVA